MRRLDVGGVVMLAHAAVSGELSRDLYVPAVRGDGGQSDRVSMILSNWPHCLQLVSTSLHRTACLTPTS
jgi:hypothetical protein